jgi:hypothetical protein
METITRKCSDSYKQASSEGRGRRHLVMKDKKMIMAKKKKNKSHHNQSV